MKNSNLFIIILASIFSLGIIIAFILFIQSKIAKIPKITFDNPQDILDLLPQPDEVYVLPNIETTSIDSDEKSIDYNSILKNEIVQNQIYFVSPLEIITLAPLDNSYIAGKSIQLAFSTSNLAKASIKQLIITNKDNQQISIFPNISTDFSYTHIITLDIPDNTKLIQPVINLIDNVQQVKELFLTYRIR